MVYVKACLDRGLVVHAFAPRLSVTLVQMEMTGLVASSWEIYHQAVIWLAYLWLSLILFSIQAIYGISPWWLSLGGLAMAALFTSFFIADIEREIEISEDSHAH